MLINKGNVYLQRREINIETDRRLSILDEIWEMGISKG